MARNLEFIPEEKVEKALNVFWKKGYNATSMQDLVDAMQINRSSLYNSFGDKHGLFIQCLTTYVNFTLEQYRAKAFSSENPLQSLFAIIDMVAGITIKGENSCMGVKTSFELGGYDQNASSILKKSQNSAIKILRKLIEEAQVKGLIDISTDAKVYSAFIFSSFAGWRQSYVIHKNATLVENMAKILKQSLVPASSN
jgi:TetR/AcrR family transcriptional repressor of nem operon